MQPYTAVIFSSRHTGIDETGYADTAAEMERLAAEQPGFRGIESARGADGYGITVSYWDDAEAARRWKRHADHLSAQRLGRTRWYDWFRLQVATVEREYEFVRPIYHLALPADWASAVSGDPYPWSTRGVTFEQEGFVHCSFTHQMVGVANRFYGDLDELVVLHVDRAAFDGAFRLEPPADGVDEHFPHLYRPITTNAVTATTSWRRDGEVWADPPVPADHPIG
ncbi:MAG: DUF952 domain-containing protein [Ilumatobacter sp.]|nr:DUF952 domain-containing protein [Ilumatobacter sp.]